MSEETKIPSSLDAPISREAALKWHLSRIKEDEDVLRRQIARAQENQAVAKRKNEHIRRDTAIVIAWAATCLIGFYLTQNDVFNPEKIAASNLSTLNQLWYQIESLSMVLLLSMGITGPLASPGFRTDHYRKQVRKEHSTNNDTDEQLSNLANQEAIKNISDTDLIYIHALSTNSSGELALTDPELALMAKKVLTINKVRLESLGYFFNAKPSGRSE